MKFDLWGYIIIIFGIGLAIIYLIAMVLTNDFKV